MWIFLSPHLNDAVYSCGGLIRTRVAAGEAVEVWTLFAGDPPAGALSPFAQEMHTHWGMGEATFAARRAEDEHACGMVGAGYRHFSHHDCIYRRASPDGSFLYPTHEHIIGRISRADRELADRLVAELENALPADAGLVCPLGLGNHVDHMLTRLVAERLNRPLLYFEDLPYAAHEPERNDKVLERAWQSVITPLSSDAMEVWQSAAASYGSQLKSCWNTDANMRRVLTRRARAAGGARLWQRRKPDRVPKVRRPREARKLLLFPDQHHPVSPRTPIGGGPAAMFDLADALHRAGADVTVVAALTENGNFELDGVRYHNVVMGENLQRHLSTLTADGFDAVIAHRGVILAHASRYFPFAVRILRLIDAFWGAHVVSAKQVNGSADVAVAVSDFIAAAAVEWGLRPGMMQVVHDGLQTEVFRPLPDVSREDNLVVFAGATNRGKGVGHLVMACDRLMERHPDLRLEVYGSIGLWTNEEEKIDWAEVAAARPNIVHKGDVGKAELARVFNRASVCVVPTDPKVFAEGFSRVSTEAQGCGCPVIVSRSGGLPETIIAGETGVIVDPLDSEHLAAAIENLLADGKLRRRMSRAAERHARRFTVDDAALAVLRIVDRTARSLNP